jgi:hypothetical protein
VCTPETYRGGGSQAGNECTEKPHQRNVLNGTGCHSIKWSSNHGREEKSDLERVLCRRGILKRFDGISAGHNSAKCDESRILSERN